MPDEKLTFTTVDSLNRVSFASNTTKIQNSLFSDTPYHCDRGKIMVGNIARFQRELPCAVITRALAVPHEKQPKSSRSCSTARESEPFVRKFRAKVPEVPVTMLGAGRRPRVRVSITARSGRRSIRKNGKGNVGHWAFPRDDGTPFSASGATA